MFHLILLLAHLAVGLLLSTKNPVLSTISKFSLSNGHPNRRYSDTLKNVPVFTVESKYSNPIALNVNGESVVNVFIDPQDAIDFLTEIYQAEPIGTTTDSGLRIRVSNLHEWLERVDPAITRVSQKSVFKLVPNSYQMSCAHALMPLRSSRELLLPLFYSKNVSLPSSSSKNSLIPLYVDINDIGTAISTLQEFNERELAKKCISVMSLVDLVLRDTTLEGYVIVPSSGSLEFCEAERLSSDASSWELT